MTKEQLEKRITELTTAKEQAIGNANACQGAINECQHWLDEIIKSEAEVKKD